MRRSLVYQEAFEIIVRLQAGKLEGQTAAQIKNDLRRLLGNQNDDADAKFAIAAFADETARASKDPTISRQWEDLSSKPPIVGLTQDLFDTAGAGNQFYRRLEKIAGQNTGESGEVLEIYCLCLLLGYEGVRRGDELTQTIERMVQQVEDLLGRAPGLVTGTNSLTERLPSPRSSTRFRTAAAVIAICVALAYVFFGMNLWFSAAQLPSPVHLSGR